MGAEAIFQDKARHAAVVQPQGIIVPVLLVEIFIRAAVANHHGRARGVGHIRQIGREGGNIVGRRAQGTGCLAWPKWNQSLYLSVGEDEPGGHNCGGQKEFQKPKKRQISTDCKCWRRQRFRLNHRDAEAQSGSCCDKGGWRVEGGENGVKARPHPGHRPQGEGETVAVYLKNSRLDWPDDCSRNQERDGEKSSPRGLIITHIFSDPVNLC